MTPRENPYGGLSDSWQDDEIREAYERDVAARLESVRLATEAGWVHSHLGGGIQGFERSVGHFGATQILGLPDGGGAVVPAPDEPCEIWTDEDSNDPDYPTLVQRFSSLREALAAPVPSLKKSLVARLQWAMAATVLSGMTRRAALRADVQAIQVHDSVPMRCSACGQVLDEDEIEIIGGAGDAVRERLDGVQHHGSVSAVYTVAAEHLTGIDPGFYEDLPLCVECASAEDDDILRAVLEDVRRRHLTLAVRYAALVSKARAAVVQAEAAEITIGRAMASGKKPDPALVRFVNECRNRAQRLLGPVQVRAERGSVAAKLAMEAP